MSEKANLCLRALYLGTTDDGVKVHSAFLKECDFDSTLKAFKDASISTQTAPFYIDVWDEKETTLIETIGASEDAYKRITGEEVLSYEQYQEADQIREEAIFGVMQEVMREKGITVPENSASESFDAALVIHRFKKQDHVIHELSVDELKVDLDTP